MCMSNRISTFGTHAARALCVVAACGLTWSCKDEFPYDDEKPSWLNSSIFESLEQRGNFTTYLRLLDDDDVNAAGTRRLTEVLGRTGSKTIFVADDDAWNAFFKRNASLPASNPWHNATSYERLSEAQKKLLIHSSMLNNAIVMENLASSDGSGGNTPTRGQYMRRFTDINLTDSITFLPAEDVPYTFNTGDINYWRRFRPENGGKGLYLVTDSTRNMMLHFTAEHMANNDITDADFAIFMGRERQTGDVHIYDALLKEKDGVAENGYINTTEKVIYPLPNMAEVIRTNGKTNIFSHILDRFSFPYYNPAVTQAYKDLHPSFTDSIFTKKYFAQIGVDHQPVLFGPDGERFQDSDGEVALKFDPGWNEFYDEVDRRADMASMFVPSDEILWEYFAEGGGGWQLVQTYAKNPEAPVQVGDYEALYRKIDDIPLSTLQDLVNVIMFRSFTGSVPSKMTKLRNDAQEDIFYTASEDSPVDDTKLRRDGGAIDTCLIASNGAVYIMNKVYGPAKYTSVAAPANISKTNLIMKWAINNGSIESQDKMKLNYYAYLMAMKSRFTFFLPSDAALQHYYDPVSFTSTKQRVLALEYTGQGTFPLKHTLYRYDVSTAQQGTSYTTERMSEDEITNRLKDILESHTIVHDGTNPIDSEDEYYLTKNGSAVKLTRDANGTVIAIQGGYQLENERNGILSGDPGTSSISVAPTNIHNMDNGRTYVIDDAPIIPASKSVYGILSQDITEEGPFSKFLDLTSDQENVIVGCGLIPSTTKQADRPRMLRKYHIFVGPNDTGGNGGGVDNNVQFFNNYRYTLFVPTNEAIDDAVAHGLPTWESILDDYNSCIPEGQEDPVLTQADSLRLQAKIIYLNNFIRGHFLDNSIFADKSERPEADYVTSSYNNELGVFVKVHCQRVKEGGRTVLKVRDDNGGQPLTVTDMCNIMARDISCTRGNSYVSPTNQSSLNNLIIQGSSFCVIHQIPGVLNHTPLNADGTYGIDWNNPSECKAYIQNHPIRETDYSRTEEGGMLKVKKFVIR